MFNYSNLKKRMKKKKINVDKLAKMINISRRALYLKLGNQLEFRPSEIIKVCNILKIPTKKIHLYFFDSLENENIENNENIETL